MDQYTSVGDSQTNLFSKTEGLSQEIDVGTMVGGSIVELDVLDLHWLLKSTFSGQTINMPPFVIKY